MIQPIHVAREQFPKSDVKSEGMKSLNINCDNRMMEYIDDIEYINRDGISLYIQLIMPVDRTQDTPLIIYVPGSAFRWQHVKRVMPPAILLANRGFSIAMVQYRGSEVAAFPAQMLDVKAAVRFMKMNASKYRLNPDNIYLMGDSSGGHTVLMAGLTVGMEPFEEEIYREVSSGVKGIVDLYAPTDITKMNDELSSMNHIEPDSPEGCLIGGHNVLEHPELTEPTVVMNYIDVDREIPPVLIFHGTNDELVPFGQSCMLYDKLVSCNKQATFYAIENAHHGGRKFWSNQVLDIIEDFIKSI